MNRLEFTDRLNYCRREVEFLASVSAGCAACQRFNGDAQVCETFGPVPADFIAVGCADWEFDEVPF